MVFGQFEGEWYRARVIDAHSKLTIVQFIDYGNLSDLRQDEMIPMPWEMKFDIVARDYIVDSKMQPN